MSDDPNGGPAFPTERHQAAARQGMTLRDWFAGQALAGMLADPNVLTVNEITAAAAYKAADLMLEARKR